MEDTNYHEPVMVREVLENLHMNNSRERLKKGSKIIDATLGTGGHALEIIKAGGEVLGIEADPEMLSIAKKRIPNGNFVLANFVNIDRIAREYGFDQVSGILFDLGVTNIHLMDNPRGFSFSNPDHPLDMRLNPDLQAVTAADLLNALRPDQLVELFKVTMEPGGARWLAKRIIEDRPIKTVSDFLKICEGLRGKEGLNPSTLPFLALRIAVNSELTNLQQALPKAINLLQKGGRLVVISFHSGEDRIVKEVLGGKAILPSEQEIRCNPRARSAKLRVYEKS